MKRTMIFATTLLLAPAALAAQDADAASRARIAAAVEAAAEAGIPAHLLESKAAEGRAKGVASARVASAVEARLNALMRARTLMEQAGATSRATASVSVNAQVGLDRADAAAGEAGAHGRARARQAGSAAAQVAGEAKAEGSARAEAAGRAGNAEHEADKAENEGARGHARADVALLVATADALEANVDGESIVNVWRSSGEENRALATATTTQLVRLGHASADAAAHVGAALRQGPGALTDLSARAGAALEAGGVVGGATSLTGSARGQGGVLLRR